MQKYKYTAINLNKKKFKGTFLAENEENLKEELAKQNLYLIESTPVAEGTPQKFLSLSSGKVKIDEITNFCRQFSILTNSGISIVESLEILKAHSFKGIFKEIIEVVYEDVKSGLLLSDALGKHPKAFPSFFQSMIYVGEMSGSLDSVMIELAAYYEMDSGMRRKMKSAFIYPAMLLCMLVGVLALMFLFVVPSFKSALASLEVEMPFLTLMIFNMSEFIVDNILVIVIAIGVIVAAFFIFGKTAVGKYTYDTWKLKIPILSNININLVASRFTHGFGLLLSSGMDLADAMEVISRVFGNQNVEKRFHYAIDDVRQGKSITMSVDAYDLFPQMLVQMISVGEKTGSLDEVLLKIAKFYDEQVALALDSLTTIIQPVVLVMMGGVIAVMFMAVYGPILSIVQTIG